MAPRAGQGVRCTRRRDRGVVSSQAEGGHVLPAAMITITTSGRLAVIVLTLVGTLLALPLPAQAQQAGQLTGSIADQTGGALAGASVTVRGAVSREGRSDAAGR